ncbi:MAG: hypothetical protein H0T70_07590, partial [Acidimicrobiia bacterium]|nr:hypothetical protein [Acidimicrobiia bacterium]
MTRAVLIAALTAILAPCLAGCSPGGEPDRESARKGGSVSVALPVAPDSLDPAVAAGPEALRALWLVHTAPLTFVHADGAEGLALRPGLAEEMPEVSDDERELRFRLRRGLRYSDGSPVRVADFERAVKRALVLNPEGRDLFGGI